MPVRRAKARGMTMVEVLVAVTLLSGALLACLMLQRNMVRSMARHRENLRALALAQELRAGWLLQEPDVEDDGPAPEPWQDNYRYDIRTEPVPLAVEGYSILIVDVWRPREGVDDWNVDEDQRVRWTLRQALRE